MLLVSLPSLKYGEQGMTYYSLTPMGVPLHRARALPTIILPSSCGNIYPFSSSLRPRDSSGDNPFPRFFLVCSLQISVALHDIALSKAFFLYSPLSALQKAFITLIAFFFCSGRMSAPLTACCGMFVPDLLHCH